MNEAIDKEPGRICYEAWHAAGRKLPPPWHMMDKFERSFWNAAAQAVAKRCAEVCCELNAFDYDDPGQSCRDAIRTEFGLPAHG